MTKKQKLFCDEYLIDLNATQAAIRAGYSPETAGAIGNENLKKPEVSAYIKSRMAELEAQRVASADEVMRFFSSVMRGEVKDQFGLDASLQDRLNAGKELMKRYSAIAPKAEKASETVASIIEAVKNVD